MGWTIDLDLAAELASSKIATLNLPHIQVDSLTWRDEGQGWPQTLRTDRLSVTNPGSLGLRARRFSKEGSLVLFRGGWTDLSFFDAGECVELVETIGFDQRLDLGSYGSLIERFFGLFK